MRQKCAITSDFKLAEVRSKWSAVSLKYSETESKSNMIRSTYCYLLVNTTEAYNLTRTDYTLTHCVNGLKGHKVALTITHLKL